MTAPIVETESPANTLLPVEDLDNFVALLTDWHMRQVATIKHLHVVPEGMSIMIGEGEDATHHTLEGEFLSGFRLGLDLALNYLGTLPFMAEYTDVPPTPPSN